MLLKNRKRDCLAIFIVMIIPVIASGCYYDKEELLYPGNDAVNACATVPATFNAQILPLITTKCAIPGCHNARASGGRIFQNYDQISGAKDRINVRAIVQQSMPPTGPLSPAEINTLKCWIDGGGLNN